jgi:hypothetical protein
MFILVIISKTTNSTWQFDILSVVFLTALTSKLYWKSEWMLLFLKVNVHLYLKKKDIMEQVTYKSLLC